MPARRGPTLSDEDRRRREAEDAEIREQTQAQITEALKREGFTVYAAPTVMIDRDHGAVICIVNCIRRIDG